MCLVKRSAVKKSVVQQYVWYGPLNTDSDAKALHCRLQIDVNEFDITNNMYVKIETRRKTNPSTVPQIENSGSPHSLWLKTEAWFTLHLLGHSSLVPSHCSLPISPGRQQPQPIAGQQLPSQLWSIPDPSLSPIHYSWKVTFSGYKLCGVYIIGFLPLCFPLYRKQAFGKASH